MPLARYQIRNEYSLADPELYRAADKDDPEALLEGVAMAGLVGVLRQLGDLAQFAAEVFHDLHEEVMATAARGHGLMVRVQQLEAEVPSLEKDFLSQTHHTSFFSNGGIDWHPNLRSEQNLITREDLPRFVMDSYEDCRGPPRLFLLDKFDVAGAGACLKRYTDPSFVKLESASSKTTTAEIHREKRSRRVKQKKAARLRNGETPEVVPTHAKLHQLLLEERIENAYSNPARLVKLKKRQLNRSGVEAKNGKSYMEKFLESPSPDYKMVRETSIVPLPVKSMSEDTSEAGVRILEISTVSPVKRSLRSKNTPSSTNEPEPGLKPSSETEMETNGDLVKVHEQMIANVTDELSYKKAPDETELADDGQKKLQGCLDGYHSDDATSEVDNYVDALTTMESEMETDNEWRPKNSFLNGGRLIDSDDKEEHQLQAQLSNSQSFGDSFISDESSSFKQDRSDEHNELQAQLSDSQSIGTSSTLEENTSFKRETGEEHMELRPQSLDSQSVGNSSASEEISINKKDTSGFSHSDSLGVMVENIKSESLLLSSKYCEYENEDTQSNHLPQIVESQKSDCNKFVRHDDAEFQEEEISDSGRASSDSHLMNSGHMIFCSDIGANSSVIQPTESQLVETSDTVELHSTVADKSRKCLVEPIVVVPDAHSTVIDDTCPVSSEKYPSNNLDDGDPCVQSGASLQISNDSALAPVIDPTGTQLVETSSDLVVEHLSSLADDEESKCYVESISAVPDTLSIVKDNACSVLYCEEHPLNNLDESDPYVHSDTSLQISDDLELAPVVIPAGTQLVEMPAESVELDSSLAGDGERKCHVESIAATSNAFSVTKDDTCPAVSSEEYSLNLDNGEPHVHSEASQHVSDDLNLAPVDECSNHSKIEILEDGFSNENCDEVLAGREVNLPGGHTISPFVEEVDLYSVTALPVDDAEVLDSKAESCVLSNKRNCQDSSPAVETTLASSLTKEQLSYFTQEGPEDVPDSAGVEALNSDQLPNSEEISRMKNDNEKGLLSCSVDAVEDHGHLEQPSFSGFVWQGNHVNVNNVFTEKVQSEDQAVSANLQEISPSSSDSYQLKMESNKAESTEIFRDTNTETIKNQLESSSDIISSNIKSSSVMDPTNLEESLSSFSDPHVNEMEFNEALARESLTELEAQKMVNQPEVASADVGLSLSRSVSHDLSDSETSSSIQDLPLKEKHRCISANDVSMVLESSEPGSQEFESSSCQNNSLPSPFYNQLVLESPGLFLQSQAGQPDADFLLRVEENSASEKFQSEHMHVSDQLEQERKSLAASESALEIHEDQPSSSDSLSQASGQDINAIRHVMDSLKPLPDPFPVASDINLGEMPPMPPLPPMQWRRGKVQHATQREVIEVSQASFQPIQGIKTNEKGQFGLMTSEREALQYQNSFLPVMAVEGDKIPYSSGFSVGVSGHPVAVPLQFPFMVNEANGQYNYLVLDRSQIQNPFLTLPMGSTGRPPHGYILASEGEMVQYSNPQPAMPPVEFAASGYDPVSYQEKLAQPPNQLIEESPSEAKELRTPSEAKELEHSLSNLEGKQEDPSVTPMPPPSMEIVQHNQSLPTLGGEMSSPLDISTLTSESEGEKPNGIPKNKLPRPRNPLIDAVAAHDKSKLRKVAQRARPETEPKIDERDSLLEQIRTKSFNLKPAVATRPSVRGPKTNLKVAAILEKANAIRQALAGSDDEDDDADSWSDS